MRPERHSTAFSGLAISVVTLIVLVLALCGAYFLGRYRAHAGIPDTVEARARKDRLVSDIRVHLLAAAEAEKSAVMAESDEDSIAFAADAERAATALDKELAELRKLSETSGKPEEKLEVQGFGDAWERSRRLDREILGLAVENTNLKARRLSNGAAADSLEVMQAALELVIPASGAHESAGRVARAAFRAQTAALRIHGLQGLHIDEPRDAGMDRIEAEMKTLDARVEESLGELDSLVESPVKEQVQAASAAYAEFRKTNAEVLSLSRRNTNIRSLSISLGQKRKITMECQSYLESLRSALGSDASRATR